MANRKVEPMEKRNPMMVTVKQKFIDKAKNLSLSEGVSLSCYIERLIVEDLKKQNIFND